MFRGLSYVYMEPCTISGLEFSAWDCRTLGIFWAAEEMMERVITVVP